MSVKGNKPNRTALAITRCKVDIRFSQGVYPGMSVRILPETHCTAHQHGCKTILDTSGPALKEGIKAAPYLIKPNHHELSELIGREITTPATAVKPRPFGCGISYCRRRRLFGAAGCCDDKFRGAFHAIPPKVKPENTIGAGDSLVAGIIYGMVTDQPLAECLRLGASLRTLAVTNQGTSVAKPQIEEVLALEKQVELKRLD